MYPSADDLDYSSTDSASDASSSTGRVDVGQIFDLCPLSLLTLSPSWRITKASSRFLSDWNLAPEACIDQELLQLVQRQLSPSPVQIAHLTTAIDDAIAARAERTTKPINTRRLSSWKARVIPVFKGDELLAIVLEWQEGPPSELSLSEGEGKMATPGLSIDEAFRILVQAVKDYAIFLLDTQGRIATWNTGAQLLKGYSQDEIVGKHFSVFYGKDDLDAKKPEMELEICMRDGRVEDEGWRYRKDGTRFWANVVITAVYKEGVHVGFGKVTRDLTERKSAESRLIAAYEESEKLKSDFLANMSHEIRTPMHGMLSACALLLDTPLSKGQRDIVGIMDESGQVLLSVINDILDYSKLASGSFSIHSDLVGITSIVTSVVRSAQTSLPPTVHFELFLAPDLPKSVQGDPLRYRQILQNIVGNAAKFTDRGNIRVRVSVEQDDHDSYIVLTEVTDTGIGIPESAAAGLFTPFTQFDATTTKRYKGTGLGLSIAKSLTELMGGRIGYRPNPERHGSIFWFTARFKKIKNLHHIQDWKSRTITKNGTILSLPDTQIAELQAHLQKVASLKSLLLVEDNVINQKVMLGLLRSLGFKNTALASNGAEAVGMVMAKPAAYDLVLMDISMPVMDGNEASTRIREAGINLPIVAMTAYALKGDKERCLEFGMNDYIPKPVDKKHLIKTLAKWLLSYRRSFEEAMSNLRQSEEHNPAHNIADRLHKLSLEEAALPRSFGSTIDGQVIIQVPDQGDPAGDSTPTAEVGNSTQEDKAAGTSEGQDSSDTPARSDDTPTRRIDETQLRDVSCKTVADGQESSDGRSDNELSGTTTHTSAAFSTTDSLPSPTNTSNTSATTPLEKATDPLGMSPEETDGDVIAESES
ncbi:hypothetical protein QBC43DRAFT_310440 [Cladorrhinum sp. PSN259]|nr:hypothetical protein QBC43DRAFT_310440 [Cladorrhinum sp. PSN259]